MNHWVPCHRHVPLFLAHTHTHTWKHRLAIPIVLVWVKGCNTWGRQDMTRVVIWYTRSTSPPIGMILERNAYESNGLNSPRTTLEFSQGSPYFWSFTVHRWFFFRSKNFRSPTAGARGLLTSWASNPSGTTSFGTGILAVTWLELGRGDEVCGQLSER